jgi:hypothetical protein
MQDNENEYDSNEEGETSAPQGKGLRAQLETVLAEKKVLEENLLKAQGVLRELSINETLASIGVSAKVAKFIPSDVTDKESIEKWVAENADVFNIQVGGNPTETQKPTIDPSVVASANRLNNLSSSAQSPSKIQDIEARIASATSEEEINALWAEARAFLL